MEIRLRRLCKEKRDLDVIVGYEAVSCSVSEIIELNSDPKTTLYSRVWDGDS